MKRLIAIACLVGIVWMLAPTSTWAARKSSKTTSVVTKTLTQIDLGAKKLVKGTVDLITLKPLRDKMSTSSKKSSAKKSSAKTYSTRKSRAKKEKKPSFWSSLFKPKKEEKRVETMKDFVGLPRPS
jgi:hypothetical protein